ncbi:hypothetical protein ACFYYY_22870 [Streptomyces sp. NPDC001834]|uniref:hypothetical protein n=1 Tax=Streptomyces sp. NPDC001834 TaxID=3364616 RepID=UPI0036AD5B71
MSVSGNAVAGPFGFVTTPTCLPGHLTTITGRGTGAAGLLMVLLTAPVLVLPMVAAEPVARGLSALTVIHVSLGALVVGDATLALFRPEEPVAVVALPVIVTGSMLSTVRASRGDGGGAGLEGYERWLLASLGQWCRGLRPGAVGSCL